MGPRMREDTEGGRDGSEIPRLRFAALGMTFEWGMVGRMGPRMREDTERGP